MSAGGFKTFNEPIDEGEPMNPYPYVEGPQGPPGPQGVPGVSFKNIAPLYAVSSVPVPPPMGHQWQYPVSKPSDANPYLWCCFEIERSEGPRWYTDPVMIGMFQEKGEKGDQGTRGLKGETGSPGYTPVKGEDYFDGRGIESTATTYGTSASGTDSGTVATWSPTPVAVAQGEYLWTKTVDTYTDATTATRYSVARMGIDGKDGDVDDLAGAGRTTETVKGNADEIANRARTLSNGELQTVTDTNKYYPLLSSVAGTLLATHQINVWDGSAWVAANNYGFGHAALQNNTGTSSSGFGHAALLNNTGAYSSGFGYSALSNNTGTSSNGFGYSALSNNTGAYSSGVGQYALSNNTGAYSNGFGYSALSNNTGAYSSGVGQYALSNNTGTYSSGFGHAALLNNTGAYSSGFGYSALSNNTGTSSNGFGHAALAYNQALKNTAIGSGANGAFLTNAAGAKTCADTDINTTDKRATITAHGFGAANAVVNLKYTATTGTAIGGLALDTIFQAKIIDENTIEFVIGSTKRNLTSAGTGTHTFTPQFVYENTTCLGASTAPNKSNQVVLGDTLVDTVKMGGTARTPASATATGVKGEMCWDADYIYVCVATNTWKRSALATW